MRSDPLRLRSDLLLLLGAAIWGLAFVGQRVGMAHLGPFTFNAVRFALGGLVLVPIMLLARKRRPPAADDSPLPGRPWSIVGRPSSAVPGGLATGVVLFAGSTFQQVGI